MPTHLMPPRKVTVRVPATSANLGPGFDCIGVALRWYTTVTLELGPEFRLDIDGFGAGSLSRGRDNLVYRAFAALYRRVGQEPPAVAVRCRNAIPLYRGLGSSAAAVVAGLVAANALAQSPLSPRDLLEEAVALEGHPDNVAPALLGGVQVVVRSNGQFVSGAVPLKGGLHAVVFVPDVELPTRRARAVLPTRISRDDAVHNIGRASLLVLALSQGRWDLLPVATEDRLHQPARVALFPAMPALFDAARRAGACGVFLSGAGPTVLALTSGDPQPVCAAFVQAAQLQGLGGFAKPVALAARGAYVASVE